MDINLIITRDKYAVSKLRESKVNYLYLTKKYVKMMRSNYKTASTYGRIDTTISAVKFLHAVNEFLGNEWEKPLLGVSEESVGATVQNLTFNGIGEGGVYKINVAYHRSRGDLNKLKALAESRGHLVDTQNAYYDISNT